MELELGIKSDPIEARYSFEWLFELLEELGVRNVQLGSFPELYTLEDGWFLELREKAARRGIARYLGQMKELMGVARREGLQWLALEPMSCLAEPPTLPEELDRMLGELAEHHRANPRETVPVYCCADVGHGYADAQRRVVHDNWSLFERQIPFMGAFHFKNTDRSFDATFGFSAEERRRGIVDLERLRDLLERNAGRFPVRPLVGYFETGGPKVGRDYSDRDLARVLRESIRAIQAVFGRV